MAQKMQIFVFLVDKYKKLLYLNKKVFYNIFADSREKKVTANIYIFVWSNYTV